MREDFTTMTVGELCSMLDPMEPGQDTRDHLLKVEKVLAEVLDQAINLYLDPDDYIGVYAFQLALAVAQAEDGVDERIAKRMTHDIGELAYHMLNAEGMQERLSHSTCQRLEDIFDAANPDAATSTKAMEASHG
jgi:hypothetical protein